MYQHIFNGIKRIIPKVSDSELIALRSGSISLDSQIFKGSVDLPKPQTIDFKFDHTKVDQILEKYGSGSVYPQVNSDIWKDLGDKGFFGLIIEEAYGGQKLSVAELSKILTKITSYNPSLGIVVMVPNSLGPGELLSHYGTQTQKEKYLPKLANGNYIPCFGLTGPHNGSDALGAIDTGVLLEKDGKKIIEIEINKRYITLAPVANLIGLAFELRDPDNLLEKGKAGTTLALLESSHPGLEKLTCHNPLNVGFPNGTLKGKLEIEYDQIIGGEEKIGEGWKMLMECLAAGRGICLPATAQASSKTTTLGVFQYSKHRKQFGIPLVKMEGVQAKLLDMFYQTWVINASIQLTNTLLDQGDKPAVISAIMKQQTTERAREVLTHGMDIHAGNSICLGYSNFLEKFYRSAPIGITVEGSNTLTRNLIIFGQGLNKSHPFIGEILINLLHNDIEGFQKNFNGVIGHSLETYLKTLNPLLTPLERQTIQFACLTNFVAVKGSAIKKEQFLSADMADLLSNLYLAYAVDWYHQHHPISDIFYQYCLDRLLNENQNIMNRVISNLNYAYLPLWHFKRSPKEISYSSKRNVFQEILENKGIIEDIAQDVYLKNNVLQDLMDLDNCSEEEYPILLDKVINVGEYPLTHQPQ